MKPKNFQQSSVVRKRIIFSGRVQGVAFRYETYMVAEELNLVGWVRNKSNGDVELEVQGEEREISQLVAHMKALKRARVSGVRIDEIPLANGETSFEIVR